MTVTNAQSGTSVHEIAPQIFRISTPVPPSVIPGGFTFNQILIVDDEPLLFHTGPRRMFPLVREAVEHVLGDPAKLRYVSFSHVEGDECGALGEWLALAPKAEPVCGTVAAMLSMGDLTDRPPVVLADGQDLALGKKRVRWLDAPHLPHNWECGYLFESTTHTLLARNTAQVRDIARRLPAASRGQLVTPLHPSGRSNDRVKPRPTSDNSLLQ
jgi:hypothetical protein